MLKTMVPVVALLAFGTSVSAAEPPYLKLAQALGTPDLASSKGAADKSQLQLRFGKDGESQKAWTKMTTVSIVKVPSDETDSATLGVITTFHDTLKSRHVHVDRFDAASGAPYTCYFEYHVGGETDKGIAYSPHAGFVTIAQVAVKADGAITSDDVKTLLTVIGRN